MQISNWEEQFFTSFPDNSVTFFALKKHICKLNIIALQCCVIVIFLIVHQRLVVASGGLGKQVATVEQAHVFFLGKGKCLKVRLWSQLYNSVNTLKLYT